MLTALLLLNKDVFVATIGYYGEHVCLSTGEASLQDSSYLICIWIGPLVVLEHKCKQNRKMLDIYATQDEIQ